MNSPERLNWEMRDKNGHIVLATQDYEVARVIHSFMSDLEIFDCNFAISHRAWFPCDFSSYFKEEGATPTVKIENTLYTQKREELEVHEV